MAKFNQIPIAETWLGSKERRLLDECARTLKAMGVREVRALVAARAPYATIRPAQRSSAVTAA